MKKHESGFTLVEIAIVLVIVGLMLGTVLKGQELITTAKVRNLAEQGSAVRTAFFAFQDRYRAVPGDYLAVQARANIPAASVAYTGNGDGQISAGDESGQAWAQLGRAGYLSGSFDGNSAGDGASLSACVATTCPSNAYNGHMALLYGSNANGTGASNHEIGTGRFIPVGILAELDRKVDDGMPNTGTFQFDSRSVNAPTCVNFGTAASAVWYVVHSSPQTDCAGVYTM